ncbi:MAG: carboxypeptidase-like regulatory domain-containing protein [Candidatus Latescibacter sp.]|nr:carboxypeptidase-like regulatory domain-containing protein [Candidatus Latescibacter sp.]
MIRNRIVPAVCLSALVFILFGCGKNTTGNDNRGNARISVMINDATGTPLTGFLVSTTPATKTALTDSLGSAALENIPPGEYKITIQKTAFAPYTKKTLLVNGVTENLIMVYLPEAAVTIKDDRGKNCPGAVITTDPQTWERIADASGQAVFPAMPQAPFRFVVKREGYPVEYFDTVTQKDMLITVPSGSPRITILSPEDAKSFSAPRNIRFYGKGNDIEDGELPDSSLVWISSIDGELGRGKDITVKELSIGQHIISFSGTDSNGKTGKAEILISVADYQTDTYFPVPIGATWSYRYLNPKFYIKEQGQYVNYILNKMTVKIENDSKNNPVRRIEIDFEADTVHYLYILTDNLEIKEYTIFVTATQEQLFILQSYALPIIQMQINTSYVPSSIFLKNITDITAETTYESKVQASTTMVYYIRGAPAEAFTETTPLTTTVKVGGTGFIATERGTFNVVNLTLRQGEYTRNWALSKGVGIIRFEDNTFLDKGTGILSDASILKFWVPGASKQVSGQMPSSFKPSLPALILGSDTSKNLFALRTFLRSMCPR